MFFILLRQYYYNASYLCLMQQQVCNLNNSFLCSLIWLRKTYKAHPEKSLRINNADRLRSYIRAAHI
jgi:hypothetical protein